MKDPYALLVEADSDDRVSGGYRYNEEIGRELRRRGLGGVARIGDPEDLHRLPAAHVLIDSLLLKEPCPQSLTDHIAACGYRLLVLAHYFPPASPSIGGKKKHDWLRHAAGWMRLADGVIVTGHSSLPGWSSHFPESLFHVVPPAVTVPRRASSPRHDRPRLLTLGRISPDKLPLPLVERVVGLVQTHDFDWHIVGPRGADPAHAHAIQSVLERARLTGRLRLVDAVPPADAERQLRRADLYLATSQFESFGMATAEALAAGVPVLGFEVGDVGRWLPGDPACRLFPTSRYDAFADGLRDWLQLGRRSWPVPGVPALPQTSWKTAADQLLEGLRCSARAFHQR